MEIAADESPKQRLTRLVRQYQTDLLRICYIQLHDTALAEDAVQETYLKAYRSMPAFRGDCSEKTWLMRIAVNVCRDMLRSAWFRHLDRRITLEQLPEPIAQPSEEDCFLTVEVMRLPQKYREAVLLYYYEAMTTDEIAQALGVAKSTVSARLEQGRPSPSESAGKEAFAWMNFGKTVVARRAGCVALRPERRPLSRAALDRLCRETAESRKKAFHRPCACLRRPAGRSERCRGGGAQSF